MKKAIKFVTFLLLICNLVFLSCKKENPVTSFVNPPPPPPPPSLPVVFNPNLVPFGTLSKARFAIAAVAASNKILFAGGMHGENCFVPGGDYGDSIESVCLSNSVRVDIYDTSTHFWSIQELARHYKSNAGITLGNKIFFSGGYDTANSPSDKVDIYDASTNSWSVIQLSEPRMNLSVAALGNKIFFAGGVKATGFQNFVLSNKVDIYDVSTNSWSAATLSEARSSISATSLGNKIIFAGGDYSRWQPVSSTIDIYDAGTNSWTASTLSEARANISAFSIDNKAFFVGGRTGFSTSPSKKIDIYDNNTNSWSVKETDFFVNGVPSVVLGNRAFLFSGRTVYMYNASSDSWSNVTIDKDLGGLPAIIAAGNSIYIASGHPYPYGGNQVYKVEF